MPGRGALVTAAGRTPRRDKGEQTWRALLLVVPDHEHRTHIARSLDARRVCVAMEDIQEREAVARLRQKSMDTQRPMVEIARAIILGVKVSGRSR